MTIDLIVWFFPLFFFTAQESAGDFFQSANLCSDIFHVGEGRTLTCPPLPQYTQATPLRPCWPKLNVEQLFLYKYPYVYVRCVL